MQPLDKPPVVGQPQDSDSSRTIFGAIGGIIVCVCILLLMVTCGITQVVSSARAEREQQEQASLQQDVDDMMEMLDNSLSVDATPRWNGDQLQVKLTFTSTKQEYKDVILESVLLDTYIPDIKMPKRVPAFGPKSPKAIVVGFPGFDGRGGKYAKVHISYRSSDPMPGEKMMRRHQQNAEEQFGVAVITTRATYWSSSADPQILIPLRAEFKKRRK